MRVRVTVFEDRTFNLLIKSPATSYFLKKAAGVEKGARQPGREMVGNVSLRQLFAIGQVKMTDPGMEDHDLEGVVKSIAAQARSIGLNVVP